ncbi:hypothetical protein [Amorphus sp. 3PC139-8]|uniref:hypothetical protein n=1 Tax=Amorphus sp. 3PC139-8 TaxID=2735676 RepID=UPI00345D84BD
MLGRGELTVAIRIPVDPSLPERADLCRADFADDVEDDTVDGFRGAERPLFDLLRLRLRRRGIGRLRQDFEFGDLGDAFARFDLGAQLFAGFIEVGNREDQVRVDRAFELVACRAKAVAL